MIIQCPDHNHSNPASTRDQKSASNELGRRLVTLNLIIQTLWVNDRLQIRVSYGARSANWNGNSKVVAKPVTTSGRWDISIISCELYSHRCSMVQCSIAAINAKTWCTAFTQTAEWLFVYWIRNLCSTN